jgi:hypothetical protein
MANLGTDQIEDRPGGDRFGARQVPDLADGPRVGAEGRQAGGHVGPIPGSCPWTW